MLVIARLLSTTLSKPERRNSTNDSCRKFVYSSIHLELYPVPIVIFE